MKFLAGEFGTAKVNLFGVKLGGQVNLGRGEIPLVGDEAWKLTQGGGVGVDLPIEFEPQIQLGASRERDVGGRDAMKAIPGTSASEKASVYLKDQPWKSEFGVGGVKAKDGDIVLGMDLGFILGVSGEVNFSEAYRNVRDAVGEAVFSVERSLLESASQTSVEGW